MTSSLGDDVVLLLSGDVISSLGDDVVSSLGNDVAEASTGRHQGRKVQHDYDSASHSDDKCQHHGPDLVGVVSFLHLGSVLWLRLTVCIQFINYYF